MLTDGNQVPQHLLALLSASWEYTLSFNERTPKNTQGKRILLGYLAAAAEQSAPLR